MTTTLPCPVILDRARLKKLTGKSTGDCIRVLVLGGPNCGKTALIVRFLTKRFIGDYDSSSEQVYQQIIHDTGLPVHFMVLDTLNHASKTDGDFKEQINWADCFIVLYSVTDAGSFRYVDRLKFLINHLKKSKSYEKLSFSDHSTNSQPIVYLVGNKQDIYGERMITYEQGLAKSRTCDFAGFHEISARESVSKSQQIFLDLHAEWLEGKRQKAVKVSRSVSMSPSSPVNILRNLHFKRPSFEMKSRSPSPNAGSGSVSPCTFRIRVKQTTSPCTGHLGDDLWNGHDGRVADNAQETQSFEEPVSLKVPSWYSTY